LRDKRTSAGWSQEQLAERLQIDAKDISAYEKGAKRIPAERLLRLSQVLGVRPVYFFGLDGEEQPLPREWSNLTLPDQGLRLHRAFVGVKSPALREAIVSLVIELAKNNSAA
jgi:transcriptional regulator with XRE-family HTH domain